VEALRFLTSPEAQRQLNRRWGYTPTRLSVFNDPELLAENPVLTELRDALAVAVLRPLSPVYAQLSDQLYRQLNTVISGERSPALAMEQLQASSLQLERAAGGAL
jgi:multiple sugar transport system substrate-binding protein